MLHRAVTRLLYSPLFFARHALEGVEVWLLDSDTRDRVAAALAIVRRTDPWLHARLGALFSGGIFVFASDHVFRGEFHVEGKRCVLSVGDGDDGHSPWDIALTIVHEAAHARLHARGIGYPEGRRARIERLCVGREIAFARRAGASPDDIEDMLDWREGLEEAAFTNAVLRQKRLASLRRELFGPAPG